MKTNILKKSFFLVFLLFSFISNSFAQDTVTMAIEEIQTLKKEDKFFTTVYGYSEAEDFDSHKWRVVEVVFRDEDSESLLIEAETDKRGMWEVVDVDISSLADGEISIEEIGRAHV